MLSLFHRLIEFLNHFTESLAIKSSYHTASNSSAIEFKRQKRLVDAMLNDRIKEAETYPCEVIAACMLTVISEKGSDLLPK